MKVDYYRSQLEQLNRELAELADKPPVALRYQTGESEDDSIFLYGIMGGKDVGKTTLINQLAGGRISIDSDILDEGTKIAVAYCHEKDINSLNKRLGPTIRERIEIVSHDRQELKNVVLMDFPDYDSRFLSHREDVHRLSRFLQGILWIVSPRKYGDHEFLDRYEAMAQSNENHYLILNKIDQLDGRADMDEVRREVYSYLKNDCAKRDVALPSQDRLLLISAIYPEKYDYPRLHNRLIRVHTPEEILKAKAHNLKAEFEKNIDRIRNVYALEDRIEEIEESIETLHEWIGDEFNEEYFDVFRDRVLALEPIQQRISAGLFNRRVEGWPVLRVLFYPITGLISFLGGRFSFLRREGETSDSPTKLLRFQGLTASNRVQQLRVRLEERFSKLAPMIEPMPIYSEAMDEECRLLLWQYEENTSTRLTQAIQEPETWQKVLVFVPLIWFPFLQPILLGWIQSENSIFSFSGIQDMFAAFVSLLGAQALLGSLIFLVILYTIWLVGLYSYGARQVLVEGKEELQNLWYEAFIPWITEVLAKPLVNLRARWVEKRAYLEGIEQEIFLELDRIMGKKNSQKKLKL